MSDDLGVLVDRSSLIVTCGPGGVGKTTSAAALGVAAARRGRRVVVVTVDPARRLADALGIEEGGDEAQRVEVPGADGELWAVMLDARATFDRLIVEQASSSAQADRVLANPVYQSIAGALAGAQEYMAVERLHQLHSDATYDLVIVDTPPSRHALDLLEAPDRLNSFLGHPVYRTLTVPQRSFARVTNAASSAFLWAVRRLAGPKIVEDVIEFFRSISGMEEGLRERSASVGELLRADGTSFVVVSSPRSEALDEARFFLDGLVERRFPVGRVVVNLVHPDPGGSATLDELADRDDLPDDLVDHLAAYLDLAALAAAERAEIEQLVEGTDHVEVTLLPLLDADVHDVDGLARLADVLVEP